MNIQLILSPDEASIVLEALNFVSGNLALNPDSCRWQFVSGKSFDCEARGLFSIDYVAAAIDAARAEDAERVRFAGFCNVF